MKLKMILILSTLMLLACSHKVTVEESNQFNQKLENLKLKSQKSIGSTKNQRLPLKAGQWARVLTILKEGNQDRSISTFKVLKVNKKSVTIEVETFSAANPELNIMQYEIENFPFYNQLSVSKAELEKYFDKIEVKKIITKYGNNAPSEMPTNFAPMAKNFMKKLFVNGYSLGQNSTGKCESPYIKAKSCINFPYEAEAFGYKAKGMSYAHSEIPFLSFVKSEGDKSDTFVINYGYEGAKSSL
jgi:hypothetical protein